MNSGVWSFDIECYPNMFSLVAIQHETKKYVDFTLFEDDLLGQADDFFLWLWENPLLVGYNNIDYDGQIVEHIWKNKIVNAREIHAFSQKIFNTKDKFQLPYKQWTFSHKHLDLMALNNYGIYGKPTSLKWLEFATRRQSIADCPIPFDQELTEKDLPSVLKYNRGDVDMTFDFYGLCRKGIDMRNILARKYNDEIIMNQPNSSIGEKIVLYAYSEAVGISTQNLKKKSTKRKLIKVSDIILPEIEFSLPLFQEVKDDFEKLELKAGSDGVINLKGVYKKEVKFQNMDVTYALGGIHGCVAPGIYSANKTHIIKTYDVTSMYPNLAIAKRMYPAHLGEIFCDVYGDILEERGKYPKETDPEMNLAYKEAANSVYGKTNASHDGWLKDPKYTVQTTINGQLLLSVLAERLSTLGEFLMLNTDGSEIFIPRDKETEYQRICDDWCRDTGINLEHGEYETMWIRDVNNYIARSPKGKVKRKGFFCIYEDYIGKWEKNPSGLIIPEAINAYFLEGKDPTETITQWNNIHDFLYGIKGGKSFEYWTLDIEDGTVVNINRHKERAIRYYCSTKGKTILKNWIGGKKLGDLPSAVPNTKGQKVQLLQHIRDSKAEIFRKVRKNKQTIIESRYPDLDYEYYIRDTWKWINVIENGSEPEILADFINGMA